MIGRLAARFGIAVKLTPSPSGGVTALVTLPPTLVTDQPKTPSGPGAIESGAPDRAARAPPTTCRASADSGPVLERRSPTAGRPLAAATARGRAPAVAARPRARPPSDAPRPDESPRRRTENPPRAPRRTPASAGSNGNGADGQGRTGARRPARQRRPAPRRRPPRPASTKRMPKQRRPASVPFAGGESSPCRRPPPSRSPEEVARCCPVSLGLNKAERPMRARPSRSGDRCPPPRRRTREMTRTQL